MQISELGRRSPMVVPISVDQYEQMISSGILEEGQPIELLDGMLIHKDRSHAGDNPMTVGFFHAWVVDQLNLLNERLRPHGCYLRTQQPIRLPPDGEPEPDGTIVRGSPDQYRESLPTAGDVLYVIEAADSSLIRDRTTKQRIYADAGIARYLLINLVDRVIEVRSNAVVGEGKYASTEILGRQDILRLDMPNGIQIEIPVDSLVR
jgi:Uma2 family endonuclease